MMMIKLLMDFHINLKNEKSMVFFENHDYENQLWQE
jgi:hypothetical protein